MSNNEQLPPPSSEDGPGSGPADGPAISAGAVDVGAPTARPAPPSKWKTRLAAAGAAALGVGVGIGLWNSQGDGKVETAAVTAQSTAASAVPPTVVDDGGGEELDDAYPAAAAVSGASGAHAWTQGIAYGDGFLLASHTPNSGTANSGWTISFATMTDGNERQPVGVPLTLPGGDSSVAARGDEVVALAIDDDVLHMRRSNDLANWTETDLAIDGIDPPPGWTAELGEKFHRSVGVSEVVFNDDHWVARATEFIVPTNEYVDELFPGETFDSIVFETDGLVVYDESSTVGAEGEEIEVSAETEPDESATDGGIGADDEGRKVLYEDLGWSDAELALLRDEMTGVSQSWILAGDMTAQNLSVTKMPRNAYPDLLALDDGFAAFVEIWTASVDPDLVESSAPEGSVPDDGAPIDDGTALWESENYEVWTSADGVSWDQKPIRDLSNKMLMGAIPSGDGGLLTVGTDFSESGPATTYRVGLDGTVSELGPVVCPDGLEAETGAGWIDDQLLVTCAEPFDEQSPSGSEEFTVTTDEYIVEMATTFDSDDVSVSFVITDVVTGEVVAENSGSSETWLEIIDEREVDGVPVVVFSDATGRPDVVIPQKELDEAENELDGAASGDGDVEDSETDEESDEETYEIDMDDYPSTVVRSSDGINWAVIPELDGDEESLFPVAANGDKVLVEWYPYEYPTEDESGVAASQTVDNPEFRVVTAP